MESYIFGVPKPWRVALTIKTMYWGTQSSSQSWQTPQPCYTSE